MPVFEYFCFKCAKYTEAFQKVHSDVYRCDYCQGDADYTPSLPASRRDMGNPDNESFDDWPEV